MAHRGNLIYVPFFREWMYENLPLFWLTVTLRDGDTNVAVTGKVLANIHHNPYVLEVLEDIIRIGETV